MLCLYSGFRITKNMRNCLRGSGLGMQGASLPWDSVCFELPLVLSGCKAVLSLVASLLQPCDSHVSTAILFARHLLFMESI